MTALVILAALLGCLALTTAIFALIAVRPPLAYEGADLLRFGFDPALPRDLDGNPLLIVGRPLAADAPHLSRPRDALTAGPGSVLCHEREIAQ